MLIIERKSEYIDQIASMLMNKKIGVVPCDTIYGLSGVVDEEVRERLYQVKMRPKSKSFIELWNIELLEKSGMEIPDVLYSLWPAPLTAILNGSDGNTHAVRVPDDDFILSLIDKTGPLFSTSVNISGEESLTHESDIEKRFSSVVDFMVTSKKTEGKGLPSTLVDMTKRPFKVLRVGAFDPALLMSLV